MTEQQKAAEKVAADQQTAQRQIRDQLQTAEYTAQNALRAWSDMVWATTDMSFAMAEKSLHYNNELFSQYFRAVRDGVGIWLRLSQEGINTWQNSLQSLTDVATQGTREAAATATRSPGRSR